MSNQRSLLIFVRVSIMAFLFTVSNHSIITLHCLSVDQTSIIDMASNVWKDGSHSFTCLEGFEPDH